VNKIQQKLEDKKTQKINLESEGFIEDSDRLLVSENSLETSSPHFKVPAVPPLNSVVSKLSQNTTASYMSPVFDFGNQNFLKPL